MTCLDRLVILGHRLLLHPSAYSMNGKLWLCSCGAKIGRWTEAL